MRESFWQDLCDLPLEMGRVFSLLPLTPTCRDLLHFAWHFNRPGEVDYTYREKERESIGEFLLHSDSHIAVFHGLTAPPGQKVIEADVPGVTTCFRKRKYPNNYSEEVPTVTEVYHVVHSGVAGQQLDRALARVDRAPYMGALTSLPSGTMLPEDRSLDEAIVRLLANRTETILVAAYGGDATLVWTRSA